jgi:hypothetical protein
LNIKASFLHLLYPCKVEIPSQKLTRHVGVNQQRLRRIANTHPLALAVDQNLLGHFEVMREA